MRTQDERARATLDRWRWHPEDMVREEFGVEPDEWQLEVLQLFPHHERLAMKACKGPGKTAVLAWFILNFLATRPKHPKVAATSITGDNLDTNLWPECAKWLHKSPFLSAMFVWSKTRISHKVYPETWFAAARTWPKTADAEQQANALAGFHGDYVLFVLDESGGMPQAVMTTAEAVLASGIETKIVQSGNPTHVDGPLHRACTTDRTFWKVVTVNGDPDDPKRSPRIKIEWARQQIASYGRSNPWVMVNVLGQFPPASINSILGVEEVEAAMHRHLTRDVFDWAEKRLGVDAARFGDDPWIIFPRQGLAAFKPVVVRSPTTTTIAARVARAYRDWHADLILIDDTGHFGHGCIDALVASKLPVIPIIYSAPATNKRYKNVRAEMWLEMADWVKRGGALPQDLELLQELTTATYSFIGGQFVLEKKEQMKERLGRSPNKADALAQTFAMPEQPNAVAHRLAQGRQTTLHDADPFAEEHRAAVIDDDPYRGIQ
jgi:phage terminase large subunit